MNVGFHHLLYKYKIANENPITRSTRLRWVIDKGVYICGILGILVIIPQINNVWIEKQTSGVSLITWVGFFVGSLFWLFYGIIHKEKPIILTNLAVIIADLAVIVGLLTVQ